MNIGLDFDNTIVSYDTLFHKIALERKLISCEIPVNKVAIRDHLRASGQEAIWTEMQGYVYGARLDEATSYSGVLDFLKWARNFGHVVYIISHKTRHPFLGPKYDLHEAAYSWVSRHLNDEVGPLIDKERAFFELSKEEKICRVVKLDCDVFLDDLPEILLAKGFPSNVRKILFDPENNYSAQSYPSLELVSSWVQFQAILES